MLYAFADGVQTTQGMYCPYTWQIVLIDEVTWCSRAMRTTGPFDDNHLRDPFHVALR